VAPNGPPDDFNNQPTRHANAAGPPEAQPPADQPESPDTFDEQAEPVAWYRRPVVLILWGLSVLVLIALIAYGITQLVHDQGTTKTPSTTSTTTPTTATTTTTTTPTTTTTTPPTTTATTTTAEVVPPSEQPTRQPTQQQPTHRHHWPSWLPTTVPQLP
jgi:cytoskeletal protein RodZ